MAGERVPIREWDAVMPNDKGISGSLGGRWVDDVLLAMLGNQGTRDSPITAPGWAGTWSLTSTWAHTGGPGGSRGALGRLNVSSLQDHSHRGQWACVHRGPWRAHPGPQHCDRHSWTCHLLWEFLVERTRPHTGSLQSWNSSSRPIRTEPRGVAPWLSAGSGEQGGGNI